MTAITATEARKGLFGLIQRVNEDHDAVEVVSRHGNAVIMSKDDYDALTETATCCAMPRTLSACWRPSSVHAVASSSSTTFSTREPRSRFRPTRVGGLRALAGSGP